MKFGCCLYVFVPGPFFEKKALGYVDAVKRASKLGFKGTGGITRTKDMDYTSIGRIRETSESLDLEVVEFITMVGDHSLSDEREEVRKAGIEYFKESVQMASELGAKIINTQSHDPFPYETRPDFSQPIITVDVPAGFDWDKVWERYVETIGRCADIVKEANLLWAMEHHPFQIVDNTNMDLKLIEDVGSEALGICFDTAQVLLAVEIPAISIYKLKDRIFHAHLSDNLGSIISPRHLTPGRGRIEWGSVLKALKDVGYDSFLTLEISMPPEILDEEHVRGMSFLREVAKKIGFEIE